MPQSSRSVFRERVAAASVVSPADREVSTAALLERFAGPTSDPSTYSSMRSRAGVRPPPAGWIKPQSIVQSRVPAPRLNLIAEAAMEAVADLHDERVARSVDRDDESVAQTELEDSPVTVDPDWELSRKVDDGDGMNDDAHLFVNRYASAFELAASDKAIDGISPERNTIDEVSSDVPALEQSATDLEWQPAVTAAANIVEDEDGTPPAMDLLEEDSPARGEALIDAANVDDAFDSRPLIAMLDATPAPTTAVPVMAVPMAATPMTATPMPRPIPQHTAMSIGELSAMVDDDIVAVPATQILFGNRARASSIIANARPADPIVASMQFRRTMIPVLLTLGVTLPVVGGLYFLLDESSAIKALDLTFPIAFIAAGPILLLFAILNMLQVRAAMSQK